MTAIQTIFKAKVLDEQALKEVAANMTEHSRIEEGVLAYEWSLSEDGKQLRVVENFTDSHASLAHMAHVGEFSPKLMAAVQLLEIEVYGEPSAEFVEATKDYPMLYMNQFDGFRR